MRFVKLFYFIYLNLTYNFIYFFKSKLKVLQYVFSIFFSENKYFLGFFF